MSSPIWEYRDAYVLHLYVDDETGDWLVPVHYTEGTKVLRFNPTTCWWSAAPTVPDVFANELLHALCEIVEVAA